MGKFSGKKCRLLSMLWLTGTFFIVELIVGYVTNSMALVADSFHMLSDVAALIIAFLSVKVCKYCIRLTINYINLCKRNIPFLFDYLWNTPYILLVVVCIFY